MDIKKIIYSILVEIKKHESVPKASDYELSNKDFADIIKIIKDEKYADNISIAGRDDFTIVWLEDSKITMKGLKYIEENSPLAKTYMGLKEVHDWLKL